MNQILYNETYQDCLKRIRKFEEERIFCGHDLAHFLDVARLAYLFSLEEKLPITKDVIYGAALLHDIGKHIQYQEGIPHEQAGAGIAEEILRECGYQAGERQEIVDAILHHRDADVREEKNLRGILYRADKMSRPCYGCKAIEECRWSPQKKNMKIIY